MRLTTSRPMLRKLLREWVVPYAAVLLIVVPLRSAIADSNWVPTGSMKPTILEGDLVYVDKLAYDLRVPLTFHRVARWSDPQAGDIAVFSSPQDGTRLIKRVIGVPGDTIEMRNEVLVINGTPLRYQVVDADAIKDEVYEDAQPVLAIEHGPDQSHPVMALPSRDAMRSFAAIKLQAGQYFMMGDSRDNSFDSRYFGPVDREQIVGRAERVLVSVNLNHYLQPRFERFLSEL
jgi:signal peptidase I